MLFGLLVKHNREYKADSLEFSTIQAHAFADGKSVSIALVNLDLQNDQAVEIELPIKQAKKITLHSLEGDPRDTNLEELKVTCSRQELDSSKLASGIFKMTLAAGKPAVLVFER